MAVFPGPSEPAANFVLYDMPLPTVRNLAERSPFARTDKNGGFQSCLIFVRIERLTSSHDMAAGSNEQAPDRPAIATRLLITPSFNAFSIVTEVVPANTIWTVFASMNSQYLYLRRQQARAP